MPRAGEILALWGETLENLRNRNWSVLAGRLDWVLKRVLIEAAFVEDPSLDWSSSAILHLDHVYASLDEEEGLYWPCLRDGTVERVVSEGAIEHLRTHPPRDTRAWARALLLRRAGLAVESVDWDSMTFVLGGGYWRRRRTLEMPDPLAMTRKSLAGIDISNLDLEEASGPAGVATGRSGTAGRSRATR